MVNVFITDGQHEDNQECLMMLVSKARLLGCNIWVRNIELDLVIGAAKLLGCSVYSPSPNPKDMLIIAAPDHLCFAYHGQTWLSLKEARVASNMLDQLTMGFVPRPR